ncbi:YfiR/HmsC family protein [Thiocystis violacea]|uniref:YfiR/HmsC family protein n=1 Tax=Thiocystis violacea TaxID=13725 RepID=UPI0019076220
MRRSRWFQPDPPGNDKRASVAWRRIAPVCLGLVLSCAPAGAPRTESFSEIEVRAVYLYNFAAFVDWPASAFETSSAPLRYCALAIPALQDDLREVLSGETVNGHPLELIVAEDRESWRRCHLLYIDHSAQPRLAQVLAATRGRPVLTVSDSEAFAREGGMIGLVRKGGRLRTFINRDAAMRAGIRISSKLLRIATLVSERRQSP